MNKFNKKMGIESQFFSVQVMDWCDRNGMENESFQFFISLGIRSAPRKMVEPWEN